MALLQFDVPPLRALARAEIRGEKPVDVGVRRQISETCETALRLQGLCRAHEAGPCRKGQRTADADAPDAERRDVADAQADVADDEEVQRFGLDRFDEGLDLVEPCAGRVRRARRRPPRRMPEDAEGIRGRHPDGRRGSTPLSRSAARRCPTDRSLVARHGYARPREVVRRVATTFAGGILDRQAGDTRRHTARDAVCHLLRFNPVPDWKSALTGTSTEAAISAIWARLRSRETATSESGSPWENANPALVVARAGKPRCWRYRAEPTSHGLGITKQPLRGARGTPGDVRR